MIQNIDWKRVFHLRLVAGLVSVIVGLILVFYPQIEKEASDVRQEKLIQAFQQLGDENLQENAAQMTELQVNDNQLQILDGARGVIRIPKIDLEMLIFEGVEETSLSKGTGIIEPEKEFGVHNVGLAGHRGIVYGKQFNRLDELESYDEIEIETKTGKYEFVIVKTSVVNRTEVGVLSDKKEPYLTLVTCTPICKKKSGRSAHRPSKA
ncbi:class D sortase [Bacillus sp. Bva_UNVM-123]|uniref:class D sortase n=1 Tax=Bacillus sp. Bva_UNVM-123 TaxID=2829798 RepID=UPI00391F22E2